MLLGSRCCYSSSCCSCKDYGHLDTLWAVLWIDPAYVAAPRLSRCCCTAPRGASLQGSSAAGGSRPQGQVRVQVSRRMAAPQTSPAACIEPGCGTAIWPGAGSCFALFAYVDALQEYPEGIEAPHVSVTVNPHGHADSRCKLLHKRHVALVVCSALSACSLSHVAQCTFRGPHRGANVLRHLRRDRAAGVVHYHPGCPCTVHTSSTWSCTQQVHEQSCCRTRPACLAEHSQHALPSLGTGKQQCSAPPATANKLVHCSWHASAVLHTIQTFSTHCGMVHTCPGASSFPDARYHLDHDHLVCSAVRTQPHNTHCWPCNTNHTTTRSPYHGKPRGRPGRPTRCLFPPTGCCSWFMQSHSTQPGPQ
jgi:hypothetical protein